MGPATHVSVGTRVLIVVSMILVIVAVDAAFFRHHFWPRLAANAGLVLLIGAFWWRFAPRTDPPP